MNERQAPDKSTILLLLIFFIMAAFLVYLFLTMKIDDFKEMVHNKKLISILIVIEDEEQEKPELTEVFYYHPRTKKGALLNIPQETGALIQSLNRVDRIASLYNHLAPEAYLKEIEKLTGIAPDFYLFFTKKELVSLVDFVEGIDIFLANPIDWTNQEERVLIPSGSVNLDGDKTRDFLHYKVNGESVEDKVKREHEVIQALLVQMSRKYNSLFEDGFIKYIFPGIMTPFDEKSFRSFLAELSFLEKDRIVLQQVLGTRRLVDSKILYFPHYEGKLLKETVKQMEESLSSFDIRKDEELVVSIEIQNGTSRNGLAGRTAQIFKGYGYDIASVKNADSKDYDNTVILDKKGDPGAAQRVANLINCHKIHSSIDKNRDETIDIIVILGKDFDGRYVK